MIVKVCQLISANPVSFYFLLSFVFFFGKRDLSVKNIRAMFGTRKALILEENIK